MAAPPTTLTLRNDSQTLLSVFVEPYPSDYWLRPGEALRLTGSPGAGEVEVIRFEDGMTVWFGEDPDPEAHTLDGSRLANGHQRPD
jgi:hypothetical protein